MKSFFKNFIIHHLKYDGLMASFVTFYSDTIQAEWHTVPWA